MIFFQRLYSHELDANLNWQQQFNFSYSVDGLTRSLWQNEQDFFFSSYFGILFISRSALMFVEFISPVDTQFFFTLYIFSPLSLWNFLYSCPPKKPYQMTRRAEQIWKMSFSNGEKPIEKFTWHRHFVMWIEKWNVISIAVAHSTILFRSARALPCFSICSFTTRKFVIWCALFFCAFLRLFFVCISRWVCYLFSPSNYITLRVSICWQRKCILFNARPGEPNWRRAKYERNEWERVSE